VGTFKDTWNEGLRATKRNKIEEINDIVIRVIIIKSNKNEEGS
jgi:hypothetical protein